MVYVSVLIAQIITNDYCSFIVPEEMEIEGGTLSNLRGSMNFETDAELFKITLQQKGLNEAVDSLDETSQIFDDYCRIIITCKESEGYVISDLTPEDFVDLDRYSWEYISLIYKLVLWKGVNPLKFKEFDAYVTEYIRESVTKGEGNVHVYIYTISSASYIWNITFSAREESLEKWTSCFESFVSSLDIKDKRVQQPTYYSYTIKGTSQNFNWITQPAWENEYVKNTFNLYSFSDSLQDKKNKLLLEINVFDYSPSGIMFFQNQDKIKLITQITNDLKNDIKSDFSSIKIIEDKFDRTKLIYSYKCEVYYGEEVMYSIIVNFTNKALVVLRAIYSKDYQFAEKEIIESYMRSLFNN